MLCIGSKVLGTWPGVQESIEGTIIKLYYDPNTFKEMFEVEFKDLHGHKYTNCFTVEQLESCIKNTDDMLI